MDYKKNLKYFQPTYWGLIIFLYVGALLFIPIFSGFGFTILVIAVVATCIEFGGGGKPTDAEIDAAVASQLVDLKARALRKLGIDEDEVKEIAPITFDGYEYNNTMIKQGKDGLYRSNKYKVVMFFFSSNEVYCFTYNFSLTESGQKESTDVYFYKDIVSVSTETDGSRSSIGQGKVSRFDYEYFKLTTTGGTSISCTVSNIDNAQRSINGMRSLIKSKKME